MLAENTFGNVENAYYEINMIQMDVDTVGHTFSDGLDGNIQ